MFPLLSGFACRCLISLVQKLAQADKEQQRGDVAAERRPSYYERMVELENFRPACPSDIVIGCNSNDRINGIAKIFCFEGGMIKIAIVLSARHKAMRLVRQP
ncbi:hypothetical protein [Bradyrhizobium sp. CCBAU 51765]|uniref:hypothetical protein n=1 Tax=Bradyrhizobium sp. CCBAU 51765 TaxID=1325102 RepID=UPI001889BB0C|nr:hypothetical protein [Bradyrhizobium sp. CCBAU 51765]